jgi:hypothetical protein
MQCLINCTQAGYSCYALQHVADGELNLETSLLSSTKNFFLSFVDRASRYNLVKKNELDA